MMSKELQNETIGFHRTLRKGIKSKIERLFGQIPHVNFKSKLENLTTRNLETPRGMESPIAKNKFSVSSKKIRPGSYKRLVKSGLKLSNSKSKTPKRVIDSLVIKNSKGSAPKLDTHKPQTHLKEHPKPKKLSSTPKVGMKVFDFAEKLGKDASKDKGKFLGRKTVSPLKLKIRETPPNTFLEVNRLAACKTKSLKSPEKPKKESPRKRIVFNRCFLNNEDPQIIRVNYYDLNV